MRDPGRWMLVYPAAAPIATCCRSAGCWCHDRVPRYPSDLTDDQWRVLEPQARAGMGELVAAQGRPMGHDLRAMCDAVASVVQNGIADWLGARPCLTREVAPFHPARPFPFPPIPTPPFP